MLKRRSDIGPITTFVLFAKRWQLFFHCFNVPKIRWKVTILVRLFQYVSNLVLWEIFLRKFFFITLILRKSCKKNVKVVILSKNMRNVVGGQTKILRCGNGSITRWRLEEVIESLRATQAVILKPLKVSGCLQKQRNWLSYQVKRRNVERPFWM